MAGAVLLDFVVGPDNRRLTRLWEAERALLCIPLRNTLIAYAQTHP
jgi:hypothetical protein